MKAIYLLSVLVIAGAYAAAQPASQTSPTRISAKDAEELVISKVDPQYPEMAIASKIQGNTLLTVQIDEQGNVTDAKVRMGHPVFSQPALDAIKQWKYRPYQVNGTSVPIETTVLIAFRLEEHTAPSELPAPPDKTAPKEPPVDSPPLVQPARPSIPRSESESQLISRVEPQYPRMATIAHIQGDVILSVVIDKQGNTTSVRGVSGHPILVQAAMDAVKQWKYRPFMIQGKPAEVETVVRVQFHM